MNEVAGRPSRIGLGRLHLEAHSAESVRAGMPESDRRACAAHAETHPLAGERPEAGGFEEVAAGCSDLRGANRFVLDDMRRARHEPRRAASGVPVPAVRAAEPLCRVRVEALRDEASFGAMALEGIEWRPGRFRRDREGRRAVFASFAGQAVRAPGGRADPGLVHRLLGGLPPGPDGPAES